MNKIVAAAVLAICTGSAFAGGYFEVSHAATNLNIDCTGVSSCKKGGTGFKVILGSPLNDLASLEVSFLNFGRSAYSVAGIDVGVATTALGLGAAFRGEIIPDLTYAARLSLAHVATRVAQSNGPAASEAAPRLVLGASLEYAFTPKLRAVAGLDFTRTPSVNNSGSGSLRMLSAGVNFAF